MRFLCYLAVLAALSPALAQPVFTALEDSAPATTRQFGFSAAWVDLDGDLDLDLVVPNNRWNGETAVYRNEGGAFTAVGAGDLTQTNGGLAHFGICFADVDNDGDLDAATTGSVSTAGSVPATVLYLNDGAGVFSLGSEGDLAIDTDNTGWSCAWGDYDNDGLVDLAVIHPRGYLSGSELPNALYHNDGGGAFSRVTDTPITEGLDTYTNGNWSDYDQDGDMDLFIGAGPVNSNGEDYLWRNRLAEDGAVSFERITDLPLNEPRDGQVWNWIDYDNDGDLDGFVTNYSGPNDFYRNDGGTFVNITEGPLSGSNTKALSNIWGDYDNDGDLDVYVTTENGVANGLYLNSGAPDYVFELSDFARFTASFYGGANGDYDLDGDLDLFLAATQSSTDNELFRNDSPAAGWVQLKLVGTTSNAAAVGARVRATATLGGQEVTQLREVTTQNTFLGHNSLYVHFGLADAERVDLTIEWPSGLVEAYEDVEASAFYTATEGGSLVVGGEDAPEPPAAARVDAPFPNPARDHATVRLELPAPAAVEARVYDALGREVLRRPARVHAAGPSAVRLSTARLPAGLYHLRLRVGTEALTHRLVVLR